MSTSWHLDKVLQLLPGTSRPPGSRGKVAPCYPHSNLTLLEGHKFDKSLLQVFIWLKGLFFPKELDVKRSFQFLFAVGNKNTSLSLFFPDDHLLHLVFPASMGHPHPKFPCDWPPLCPPTVTSVLDLWKQLWFHLLQTVKRCLQSYSRVRSLDFCWLIRKLAYSQGKNRHWLLMSTFWNLTWRVIIQFLVPQLPLNSGTRNPKPRVPVGQRCLSSPKKSLECSPSQWQN